MKRHTVILCLALAAVLLCVGLAEAKRLGGGGSFGSKPSYSRSYSRPVSPSPGYTQPSQQMAQPRPAAPAPVATPQPGFFSRFGMGLGGLMVGGLIGSMLFGGSGMGGWGGGGIGLLEILLIGVIIYFAVKLLRRRKDTQEGDQTGQGGWQAAPPTDARSQAAQSWDSLRSQPEAAAGGAAAFGAAGAGPETQEASVPPGFNVPEFLEGAKTVYARLQHSWDRRDLADIALFTTPEVLDEIRRQAAADPAPSKTEILLVNARLLEFREEERNTVASVYFDVLMREDASEDRPKQIRELWHFSRPTLDTNANWRLEGIQQMEA